jgi:hypothetical protein
VSAVAERFGPVQLDPDFAVLRPKLLRGAFVPSRIYDDAAAWPRRESAARIVELYGSHGPAGYRLAAGAHAPPLQHPGDYAAVLSLTRLGEGEFEWHMHESLAVGEVRVADLAQAAGVLFERASAAAPSDARGVCREALPRAARVLGRLFTLEEARLGTPVDGAAEVTLRARLDPAGLEDRAPRYARFLRRQALTLRFQAVASDQAGRWWGLEWRDGLAALHLRLRGGSLAPLDGPPRAVPDRLQVRVDLSSRRGLFGAGFEGLEADVELMGGATEKGFVAHFTRVPSWGLPPLAEPLLRRPLRRPFEGQGALLRYAISESSPTRLIREYRLSVQESWILRWLGGFMGGSVEEFRREAEAEADRFSGEVFWALRDDVMEAAQRH